ncbi:DUF7716 domain-containing protein [Lysinibacillus pakistanensis]|uniref:DUF7716 domain-containing protein n=1 Tax=Lysinibacillus pakistanensis TaxID=759811 RepID=A0AAX3WTL8_9BACI|nr:hypothetical protein [Lysinibacillus pakistanensis]MDM5234110.1 hypothetical protein [Lysinibacillus pakistanensis]WHY44711.1 hypothetical protein QNH22_15420 [Lysinibacillus pakistanensis]WHY49717.1 hypothetical protein QNH24_15385 [Lysinibacillus pakistanensis]
MTEEKMNLLSISDVLSHPKRNPETWFYLPPNLKEWNLNTRGIFSLDSFDFPPNSDDFLPEQAKKNGWIETLDGAGIEDVIDNVNNQFENPSLDQLFQAFLYYFENDAFLVFKK